MLLAIQDVAAGHRVVARPHQGALNLVLDVFHPKVGAARATPGDDAVGERRDRGQEAGRQGVVRRDAVFGAIRPVDGATDALPVKRDAASIARQDGLRLGVRIPVPVNRPRAVWGYDHGLPLLSCYRASKNRPHRERV